MSTWKLHLLTIILLAISTLQWLILALLDLSAMFEDTNLCLVIFILGLTAVALDRFLFELKNLWIHLTFALTMVEFVTLGATAYVFSTYSLQRIAISFVITFILLITMAFMGPYMAKLNVETFHGWMCLGIFICLFTGIVILTAMLSSNRQISYVHVFLMLSLFLVLITMFYESFIIHPLDDSMGYNGLVHYSLFQYGQLILFLVLFLKVTY
ncbi:uncharacterized protein LOC142240186 [Haematobia irritans]|uniref:uncharacterized protein LOC142240186 n=1 Tax=Haematobia irritans TaxID=7368 RepID=UPI003F4F8E37